MRPLASYRVALFLPTLRGGGAERNFLRLAQGLAARGIDVTVVVAQTGGPNQAWVPEDVRFVDLEVRLLPVAAAPLARYLRRDRPDILLSALNGANVAALAARSLARVDMPVVVTERNTLTAWVRGARGFQNRWLIPWLVRRFYPRADAIVGVSRGVADDLAQFLGLPSERILSIPNPVVDARLEEMASESIPIEWDTRIGDAPLVISVGRFVPQKDHELLLRSFREVCERVPDARLALLGDGDERERIDRLIDELDLRDSVDVVGFQANPYAWMARADVLALSSRFEGLPTVLIEALACGARVVSTDCPSGPREILEHGRWGRLVPVADREALADALVASLQEGRWNCPMVEALGPYTAAEVVTAYMSQVRRLVPGPNVRH